MKYFLFLTTILSIGLWVYIFQNVNKNTDELFDSIFSSYSTLQNLYQNQKMECRKSTALSKALSSIDWKDYDRETNNCYDHTKKLQKELAKADIASSIFINKDRSHAWLGVWIEAVKGTFISSTNKFEVLEVRDENLKVICD